VIALEQAQKPADYREAILRMGELGVLPADFAAQLAPIANFRNILVHDYIGINWDRVHANLQDLNDLDRFADYIRKWLASRLTDT
jgi:uncharacterized protein YutE (UPF0331/DUF86 family)